MSELATLARPYATAAFKRAQETDKLNNWSNLLQFLASVAEDKSFVALADNPKVGKERLSLLLIDIAQDQADVEGKNFIKLLVENVRLSLLPQIASQFEQQKADFEGYIDVDVITAFAFNQDEQKKFTATLEKTLSKKVRIHVAVDKSLIGGVLVRAGDRVFDGSIKGQLQQLAKRL